MFSRVTITLGIGPHSSSISYRPTVYEIPHLRNLRKVHVNLRSAIFRTAKCVTATVMELELEVALFSIY